MEYLLELAASPAAWVALATLVVMEIVLGIDNLIFISILTNKLPEQHRQKARRIGIGMALILRLALLSTIAFIVQLTEPVIDIFGQTFSWKDMILIAGGLFLLWKATTEIHHSMDPAPDDPTSATSTVTLGFLIMIGMTLIAEGFGAHVPKGYVYAAMAFSAAIEMLNMMSRRARQKRVAAEA